MPQTNVNSTYIILFLVLRHVAIEHLGNGIWKVFFRNVFLGFFDERDLRNKQQSTRLKTNLL
ncbi:hypothetical protein BD809_104233 [Aquimarina intermedia]|uniref:Uncharacterized protein n=1 Tax=Aquimarina intermedia TaxID=350814 RepID=A0A5S5C8V3_9FLAO|nr:hypothetical protein BD809_104233 [Aquimarina intermedia]